ncbi:ATP synthase subunit I [Xanthomonadaceae bacterium JHOS43]|nr:ATP synthase subunit I [Xanthomonadaceae bacterium JHOS43]MCX7562027.1 ATP synthase subunit I [Xanthomonadaceae bacterium XH05]
MFNSVTHGRQQARKVLVVQAVAVVVSALALLIASPAHALAAVVGGSAMAAGSWLSARLAFAGTTPAGADTALGRLLAGIALKWLLLIAALLLGVAVWRLPPPGLACGVIVALLAQIVVTFRR